jgi:hypothetical protein
MAERRRVSVGASLGFKARFWVSAEGFRLKFVGLFASSSAAGVALVVPGCPFPGRAVAALVIVCCLGAWLLPRWSSRKPSSSTAMAESGDSARDTPSESPPSAAGSADKSRDRVGGRNAGI